MSAAIVNRTETQQNHDINQQEGDVVIDKDAAREALKTLASGVDRAKIAQLRDLYQDIRTAQKSGVTNEQIVVTLKAQGLDLSLKSFETMMYRLRREKGDTRPQKRSVPPTPPDGAAASVVQGGQVTSGTTGSKPTPTNLKQAREREIDLNDFITKEK